MIIRLDPFTFSYVLGHSINITHQYYKTTFSAQYFHMHRCVYIIKYAQVRYVIKHTNAFWIHTHHEKKLCKNLRLSNFFSYMDHLIKPPLSLIEVVVEVFLKILPNFVTLKPSLKFVFLIVCHS